MSTQDLNYEQPTVSDAAVTTATTIPNTLFQPQKVCVSL